MGYYSTLLDKETVGTTQNKRCRAKNDGPISIRFCPNQCSKSVLLRNATRIIIATVDIHHHGAQTSYCRQYFPILTFVLCVPSKWLVNNAIELPSLVTLTPPKSAVRTRGKRLSREGATAPVDRELERDHEHKAKRARRGNGEDIEGVEPSDGRISSHTSHASGRELRSRRAVHNTNPDGWVEVGRSDSLQRAETPRGQEVFAHLQRAAHPLAPGARLGPSGASPFGGHGHCGSPHLRPHGYAGYEAHTAEFPLSPLAVLNSASAAAFPPSLGIPGGAAGSMGVQGSYAQSGSKDPADLPLLPLAALNSASAAAFPPFLGIPGSAASGVGVQGSYVRPRSNAPSRMHLPLGHGAATPAPGTGYVLPQPPKVPANVPGPLPSRGTDDSGSRISYSTKTHSCCGRIP